MDNITLSDILIKFYPEKKWMLVGDNYEGLDWKDESSKPTLEELENLKENIIQEQQTKINAKINAMAKLVALGLNEEEVQAIIGA